jgi:hypothetical protein
MVAKSWLLGLGVLVLRRQRDNESFQTVAFEMDLMYRTVHNLSSDLNVKEVFSFISERALPILKPHLLAHQAKDLYELVLYGQSAKSDTKKPFSGSKWVNKESLNNRETSPKPVLSEPKVLEKPSNMTSKKVEVTN